MKLVATAALVALAVSGGSASAAERGFAQVVGGLDSPTDVPRGSR